MLEPRSLGSMILTATLLLVGCGGADDAVGAGAGGASSSTGEPRTGATTATVTASSSDAATSTSASGGGSSSSGGGDAGGGGGGGSLARADVPGIACDDAVPDVYVTPTGLPAMSDAARGDVVRCAKDTTLALADVEAAVTAKGIKTPMTSGVTLYDVAFRTTRGDGTAGVTSARVYLPSAPQSLPLPVITVGHPTNGIADGCAPSKDEASNQDLALPWAGLGYAVIVADYAGLGNEGTQSYLDNRDQGQAVLDGARALRKLLATGALSDQVLAVGYSQGGGAVLSAQALAKTYGAGGDLVGVIAFAPEWPTRLNSFGYVDMLENPDELTIQTGISEDVVSVMRTYGYFYNHLGAAHADDAFPAGSRSGFDQSINSLCQTPLGGYLQGKAWRVGDVFDDGFRTAMLACIDSQGADAGCVEPAAGYYRYLVENVVTADPTGAKVLFVQGLADYIMPAASEAACNIQKLAADGVTPQVCVDAPAQHETVVARNVDFAMTWGLALLAGHALPTCSSDGMPACRP